MRLARTYKLLLLPLLALLTEVNFVHEADAIKHKRAH